MNNKTQDSKGISLTTLVITIIVMLIIAGVGIYTAIDSGGVFENAKLATEKTRLVTLIKAYNMWQIEKEQDETLTKQNFIDDVYNQEIITAQEKADLENYGQITIANEIFSIGSMIKNLTLAFENLSLIEGGTGSITCTTEPVSDNSEFIWTSSNPSAVTVVNGNLTAVAKGTSTITCKLEEDETISAQCLVTVLDGSEIIVESEGGEVLEVNLLFKNFPSDCTLQFKFGTNLGFDPEEDMQGLRDAAIQDNEGSMIELVDGYYEVGTWFYSDYFFRLQDSFGNLSDYYWVSPNFACFTKDTKVLTENGSVNIQDIVAGDKVYSMNIVTQTVELKEVLRTFKNEVDYKLCRIYTDNSHEYVEATYGHEFYTKNRGWVKAYYLQEGDILVDSNNNEKIITKKENIDKDEKVTVYNFEVQDNHNYFVGENNVLVHNLPEPSSCVLEEGHQYTYTNIGT